MRDQQSYTGALISDYRVLHFDRRSGYSFRKQMIPEKCIIIDHQTRPFPRNVRPASHCTADRDSLRPPVVNSLQTNFYERVSFSKTLSFAPTGSNSRDVIKVKFRDCTFPSTATEACIYSRFSHAISNLYIHFASWKALWKCLLDIHCGTMKNLLKQTISNFSESSSECLI